MKTLYLLVVLVLGALAQDDSTTEEPDENGYIMRLPPTIVEQRTEKVFTFRSDDQVTLPCVAESSPSPQYQWMKNGAVLDLNLPNIHPNAESGTIIINPLGSLDEGYYQCFASNLYGKALSNVVYLERAILNPYPPQKDPTPYDVDVGRPFTVRCEGTKSVPVPTFSWSTLGSMTDTQPMGLTLDERVNTDIHGNLVFANALDADERNNRIYQCSVFNPFMATTVHGSYSQVTVNPSSAPNTAPSVSYNTQTPTVALVGKEIILKCLFSGLPTPKITWGRRGGQYLPIGRHDIRNYNTELIISNIEEEDEGEYFCKGSNSLNSEEVTIIIDVQEEPMFATDESQLMNKNATDGDTVEFHCDARAEPSADITWLQNGDPLNVDFNPRMSLSGDSRTLTIDRVCKTCPGGASDLMVLQCNASNFHGYAFSAGYLNVLTPTVIFTEPEDFNLEYYEPVTFQCEASSDDSTTVEVDWLRDGERIVYKPGLVEKLEDNSLRIITEDREDGGADFEGRYTCLANNTYSWANATATLIVPATPAPVKAGIGDYWYIFVIIAVIILLLLLLLICCICIQRNKGDSYPVDEKERANGNDPEKELADSGYHDYQRPEDEPMKGSRASLSSTIKLGDSDDEGSLAEYGDIDAGKFNEDGSFIGQYTGEKKKPSESNV